MGQGIWTFRIPRALLHHVDFICSVALEVVFFRRHLHALDIEAGAVMPAASVARRIVDPTLDEFELTPSMKTKVNRTAIGQFYERLRKYERQNEVPQHVEIWGGDSWKDRHIAEKRAKRANKHHLGDEDPEFDITASDW